MLGGYQVKNESVITNLSRGYQIINRYDYIFRYLHQLTTDGAVLELSNGFTKEVSSATIEEIFETWKV